MDDTARLLEAANIAKNTGDNHRALELYTPLAEQGNPDAMLALGVMIGNGWGTERNIALADDWLQKARMTWEQSAKQGDPRAFVSLGVLYKSGVGVPPSMITAKRYFSRAAKLAQPLADSGDTESQYLLGSLLLSGRGVEKDRFRSVGLLEQAAASGHRKSMRLLMHIFECNCKGFPPEPDRVANLRQQLAGGSVPVVPEQPDQN